MQLIKIFFWFNYYYAVEINFLTFEIICKVFNFKNLQLIFPSIIIFRWLQHLLLFNIFFDKYHNIIFSNNYMIRKKKKKYYKKIEPLIIKKK